MERLNLLPFTNGVGLLAVALISTPKFLYLRQMCCTHRIRVLPPADRPLHFSLVTYLSSPATGIEPDANTAAVPTTPPTTMISVLRDYK